jgi:hypothetical protein
LRIPAFELGLVRIIAQVVFFLDEVKADAL